jgi:hypothetical protein
MGLPRRDIINYQVTTTYHIICSCVQQDALLASDSRKQTIVDKLKQLQSMFFVAVLDYAVLSNHLHVVLRASPECVDRLDNEQVIRLWALIHPPSDRGHRAIEVNDAWIRQQASDANRVAATRKKLSSISQFMKELNQSIAQRANREDGRRGHFWAGRFKSVAILDQTALLVISMYVDLNPLRAGLCDRPEAADFTTISERTRAFQKNADMPAADASMWVTPIAKHADHASYTNPMRCGLFENLTLYDYLTMADQIARLPKEGKAHLGDEVAPIWDRIHIDEATYVSLAQRLRGTLRGYLFGEAGNVARARRQLKAAAAAR